MGESFKISVILPATPKDIYDAWLDSKKHGSMTGGGKATITPLKGKKFTAWDEYIFGSIVDLEENKKIVLKWRTTDFSKEDEDSIVELILEPVENRTKVTIIHTNIPIGQGDNYKEGWKECYFDPMKIYFGKKRKSNSKVD